MNIPWYKTCVIDINLTATERNSLTTIMKKLLIILASASALQGCGKDFSEKIEGVKWKDEYSRLGGSQAYTTFLEGEVRSCAKNEGTWRAGARYEISGDRLTIQSDRNKEKKVFTIHIEGNSDKTTLILTSKKGKKMIFPISINAECPI